MPSRDFLRGEAAVPLGTQPVADEHCSVWSREWLVGAVPPPPPPHWPLAMGAPMPAPSVAEFRRACLAFPVGVGLGWDKTHPRAFLRLSHGAITALLRIMVLAEILGAWPDCIGCLIVVLLPKADGGLRPIGLLPTIVRIWSRMRLVVAQQWQRTHERPFFYAGPMKSSTMAVWKQAALAETARGAGAAYGIAMFDLQKAFERVPWDLLAAAAVRCGYNLYLLRLSLAAYALEKSVTVAGASSRLVKAARGLTAGSSFATIELRVLLLETMDIVARSSRIVTLTVYVDDVSVEAVGSCSMLMQQWVAAMRLLVAGLVAKRMEFSETKNTVVASSQRLAVAAAAAVPEVTIHVRCTGKSLGAGIGAGVRRCVAAAAKRARALAARRGRFRFLRRAGVNTARLLRTGGVAAMTYGSPIMGLSPSALLKQRRAAAAALACTGAGGDLDLTLALADGPAGAAADPAFSAHADPIGIWATAVWESWMPRSALLRTVAAAKRRLAAAKNAWSAVHGPAAAVVATAARIGWTFVDGLTAMTDEGEVVNFCAVPPLRVRRMVNDAVRRWRWRCLSARFPSLAASGGGAHGPFLQPIFKLLDTRLIPTDEWSWQHKAALRSAVLGRQWPQQRLFSAGLAPSKGCRLCAAAWPDVEPPLGTLLHRAAACPCLGPLRRPGMPRPAVEEARAAVAAAEAGQRVDTHWVTRAILPSLVALVPPPWQTWRRSRLH